MDENRRSVIGVKDRQIDANDQTPRKQTPVLFAYTQEKEKDPCY